jgi:ATP-dependent DNA helicase RecG
MSLLEQNIMYLQGVGPNRAALLEKELGITTLQGLLDYFPYKYIDRSRIYKISDINGSMPYVQLMGEILSFEEFGTGRTKRLVAHFSDGTGVIDLVWFNGVKYAAKNYDCHVPYIIFGKPTVFNGRTQVTHPDIDRVQGDVKMKQADMPLFSTAGLFDGESESIVSDDLSSRYGKMVPAYSTTERMKKSGLSTSAMAKLTANMLQLLKNPLPETLPPFLIARHNLLSRDEAYRNIHYPQSPEMLRRAEIRLKYEELFYVQLNIIRYTQSRINKYNGIKFTRIGEKFNGFFYNCLPFPLTGAQKRVIKEIHTDMKSGRQMNRLLQGDVGSGKTLVALMCALIAVDNGCQACIMAPTEILAEQHLESLKTMLKELDVNVELLTGIVKGKKRKAVLDGLVNGSVDILVGTHAVIEDNVVFRNLGLVVIDEQHRFGVQQRAKLWTKNNVPPHVLVMTATPIPRTLAMTLYGDLDVSVIDELPPGRKPVKTIHSFDNRHQQINNFIRKEISMGRQVYYVFPLIEESEKIDLKNLETGYENICHEFPEFSVSKVHGKMKPVDKEAEMQRFVSGETQILVSTTVIEVGVNVPNASVMVIENAERFGLSQLHQLRGRVGRGADQSYCILVTSYKLSDDTRKRIQIMVDSNDGFEIAEQDLKLRGPGDLEGTQQSGMAFDLKIANLAKDGNILQAARDDAYAIVTTDIDENDLANKIIWQRFRELKKSNINWSAIS